jgi:hypothetical protein
VRGKRAAYKRRRYATDPAYRAARKHELRRYRSRRNVGGNHAPLRYPYLLDDRVDGAELLLRINALVPRGLPETIRADVCQALALAVLMGEIRSDEIDAHVSSYVRQQYALMSSKYATIYLDTMSAKARENVEVYAQQLVEAWK